MKAQSRLVDLQGNPIEYDMLSDELAAPSMAGIRQPWHPSVIHHLTPIRLAHILDAAEQGEAYEFLTLATEMEDRADLHYASVLGTRKLAITGLNVQVNSATDDAADVKIADAIRELTRMPEFGDLVSDLTDALGKGYAACEMMWNKSGQQWLPERYIWRDPRFFRFDRDTGQELRLIDQADLVNGVALAPFKFIVHVPRIRTGMPIRGGLARLAAVAYMCKAWAWRDWMAFADVFGLPMRVGKYGPGASKENIAKLISAVANLGSDAAAVIPDSMRIDFEAAPNVAGAGDFFQNLADWWDRQISKGILGQTMTADDGASLAQAKIHNDVRIDLLAADARALENTLNRQLLRPFIDLNYGTQQRYPSFKISVPEPEDLKLLVDALAALVPLGLRVEQSVVRDKLGLPDPEPDADVLIAQPTVAGGTSPPSAKALNTTQSSPNNPASDLSHHYVEPTLPENWLPQIMVTMRESGQSAALEQLANLYPHLSIDQLVEQLTHIIFVAETWGRLSVQGND